MALPSRRACVIGLAAMMIARSYSVLSLAQSSTEVVVSGGAIRGVQGRGVAAFPRAAAATEDLRWRVPQPVAIWRKTLDAPSPSADCPQRSPRGQGEDCLTLSVWTSSTHPQSPKPVLVWLHGGAFIMGGTASLPDNGVALANNGVFVVTLNYRLGMLGWFAHPELAAEAGNEPTANLDLMGQIAALRWVKEQHRRARRLPT